MGQPEPKWHPLLAAVEGPVGTWRMVDSLGAQYGLIRLVRVNGEPKYRVEFKGRHVGYGGTLRSSCEKVQAEFIRNVAPSERIGWADGR